MDFLDNNELTLSQALEVLTNDFVYIDCVEIKENKLLDHSTVFRNGKDLQIPHWEDSCSFSKKLDLIKDYVVYEPDRENFYAETRREVILEQLSKDPMYYVDFRVRLSDGIHYAQLKFSGIKDVYGELNKFVVAFINTDKQMEEQDNLERTLAEQKAALEAMDAIHMALGSGDWSLDFDEQGNLTTSNWSDRFRDLLGYSILELPNTFKAWTDLIHLEDKKDVLDHFWDVVNDFSGEKTYNVEYRMLTKNNGFRWYRATGRMIRRADGTPHTFIGVFLDVDELKRHEIENKAMLESKESIISALSNEYLTVFHVSPESNDVEITKMDGFITTQIDSGVKELPYDKMISAYGFARVYPEDRDKFFETVSASNLIIVLRQQKEFDFTFRVLDNDKVTTHFFLGHLVRESKEGEEIKFIAGFKNIDSLVLEREKQNEALANALEAAQHANRAKTVFLNNMSHDIRTPMNAIIGYTGMAASHIDNQELLRDYLTKINNASNHLLSLINDVLDMSRIESGKVTIDEKPESLAEILHNLHDIVNSNIKAKNLDFFLDVTDVRDERVYCDKLRLNQVLLNILSNSIKYTKAGGTVSLRLTEKSTENGYGNYEFIIKDNGIGMSEEYLKTIFDPFTREKSSTVSGIQGTGLGMAITKNIVDMFGGEIKVESELDKGTTVTINFKFKIDNADAVKDYTIKKLLGARSLVVDDDVDACISVSRMLKDIGMRSDWCSSGKEAILRAEDAYRDGDQFRVYIIDWLMPDINGIETTRRIRSIVGPDTPIIILSSYDWSDIEDEAREAGVTEFVSKPLFLSDLQRVLSKLCDEEFQETEHFKKAYNFKGKKLLLVEDNEFNREIARDILEEDGFVIDEADDGTVAVKMMSDSEPGQYDAILMDIQMPIMNGYDATRQIRALENSYCANIPIIAMTANAFDEDRQMALEAGMNEHLAKPIDIIKLNETLAKYLL